MNYIIITPVKNEEKSLKDLIRSILSQSIKPALWVIVDDGSTDKTSEIIQDTRKNHSWVESIYLNEGYRDLTIHISEVIKRGFDFAQSFCKEHTMTYDCIMFLDSDMYTQDNDFFKKLLAVFEKDEDLGIASGNIQYIDASGNLQDAQSRYDTISGGEMMCRRACIEEIGGVPVSYAWESVMRVKAMLKEWKIKRFNDIKMIHSRETGSAEGLKKGYYLKGTSEYYLDMNPCIVAAKGFKYCFKRPHYLGFAYLFGYISSYIHRKEKTNDPVIREYYYYRKPREIWQYYFNNKSRRT